VDFLHVRLRAAARLLPALAEFYGGLGIAVTEAGPELVTMKVGTSRVDLVRGDGDPFYHFALLAPGDRSEAMAEWADERTTLLPDPQSGEAVFDFTNWSAKACYFHDPAGNIVELIAHRGLGETSTGGRFSAGELLGLSEPGSSATRWPWPRRSAHSGSSCGTERSRGKDGSASSGSAAGR
jgi:hypothetical protein